MVCGNEKNMEMMNLQEILGLPILLDKQKLDLIFDGDFAPMKKFERELNELNPFLRDSDSQSGPDPVYYVWRGVYLKSEEEKVRNSGLRLDLILMPPGKIGDEFVKTAGHYHLQYPEMYFILCGRAHILTQLYKKNPKIIEIVHLTEASAGEQVFIPRGFGHNTINVFDKPLVFATLADEKLEDDYESYKNNRGASYYFLTKNGQVDIVKNPNYDSIPELKKTPAEKASAGAWRNWNTRTLQERMDESH